MRDNDNYNLGSAASGLLERWRQATDALPGARFLRGQAQAAEERALRHLQHRLDQISGHKDTAPSAAQPTQRLGALTPTQRLQSLLDDSVNLKPDSAEQDYYLCLLNQLVPDEARILAALSDGGLIAICHVEATSRLGTHSERLMSYASRVGHESGVLLTSNVPFYLSHLATLELIETGPEDKSQGTKYELLETNSEVRALVARIENELHMKPRLARHTVRLSDLGLRLWQACQAGSQVINNANK